MAWLLSGLPHSSSPIVHVEAVLAPGISKDGNRKISQAVFVWLNDTFTAPPGEEQNDEFFLNRILSYEGHFAEFVELLRICGSSSSDGQPFIKNLNQYEISVATYELHDQNDLKTLSGLLSIDHGIPTSEDLPHIPAQPLPNRALDGSWEKLVYKPAIHNDFLEGLIRLVCISRDASIPPPPHFSSQAFPTSRIGIILLYGPAGSGKSTLCKTLAQKLSIRLKSRFRDSMLIELDSQTLYSKYFSESAKIVGMTFNAIGQLLECRKQTLICLVIDEIESLTGARDTGGKDPGDQMRAVNALLTAIDRLQSHPNLVVFCTTNLVQAMDKAFFDRIDYKMQIPSPCSEARYEMLRQCYIELSKYGIFCSVAAPGHGHSRKGLLNDKELVTQRPVSSESDDDCTWDAENELPINSIRLLRYGNKPSHPSMRLWRVAERAEGLSGRSLKRLPKRSVAFGTSKTPCPVDEAFAALEAEVDKELDATAQFASDH